MTLMKIEVFPDTSIPAGGHAIIRIKGMALLPPGATFRIDPIDDALDNGDPSGWPYGELHPIETRQTADGVEMRVGPEVVDAPLLEPGTPVTISVPDGDFSAELVWPDLPVSSGTFAAPVVMTPSQMAAELASAEGARLEAGRATQAAQWASAVSQPPPLVVDATVAARLATLEQKRMQDAARDLEAVLAFDPIETPGGMPPLAKGPDAAATGSLATEGMAAQSARGYRQDRSLSSLTKIAGDWPEATNGADNDTSLPAIVMKRASESAAATLGVNRGELRPDTTIDGQVSPPATQRGRLMPFLAGAGAAGIAAAAIFAVLAVKPGFQPFAASESDPRQVTVATVETGLADSFTAGYQSPRGEIATDVDLPTALRLADYNLHGIDRPVDRAEAEFWLKKAMSLTASHSQLRWAMTQLGTLQAEPVTGPPDYDKARILWEIAAANGDPVAMCFLGTLLEFGLGAAADKAKALEYFQRSKGFGGCPNADESIARLSR